MAGYSDALSLYWIERVGTSYALCCLTRIEEYSCYSILFDWLGIVYTRASLQQIHLSRYWLFTDVKQAYTFDSLKANQTEKDRNASMEAADQEEGLPRFHAAAPPEQSVYLYSDLIIWSRIIAGAATRGCHTPETS